MLKKVVIGVLLLTVIGAGAAAAVFRASAEDDNPLTEASPLAIQESQAAENPQVNAQENMGEPWSAKGTIIELDANGFTLAAEGGEEVYIELGPSDYWGSQGIDLALGTQVSVQGTINDGMIHAYQVSLSTAETLQLRTEGGQPLWSGGAGNSRGQNAAAGAADGQGVPEPQAQVDEWLTISGTLIAFQRGSMTVSTPDGELLTFQTGQPRFFAEQGVTFSVGEQVSLVGFYSNDQFTAGEITQDATGARVMLRDPNGRPLWAGPGSGNGNGNGGGQ